MLVRRIFVIGSVLCTALLSSQAPEFAQQYQQRLGGAIDELRIVVGQFDQDASNEGLTRDQALEQLNSAQQAFFQSRAVSMNNVFGRYTGLTRQQESFKSLNPALKPVALLSTFDKTILQGTLGDYQPAIPLTIFGLLWTAVGAMFGWIVIRVIMMPFGSKKTQRRRKVTAPKF